MLVRIETIGGGPNYCTPGTGAVVPLSATIEGGTAPFTTVFSHNGSGSIENTTYLSGPEEENVTLTVTVTDATGCSASDSTTFLIGPCPDPNWPACLRVQDAEIPALNGDYFPQPLDNGPDFSHPERTAFFVEPTSPPSYLIRYAEQWELGSDASGATRDYICSEDLGQSEIPTSGWVRSTTNATSALSIDTNCAPLTPECSLNPVLSSTRTAGTGFQIDAAPDGVSAGWTCNYTSTSGTITTNANNGAILNLPVGQTATVSATWAKNGCPDVVRTVVVENPLTPECTLNPGMNVARYGDTFFFIDATPDGESAGWARSYTSNTGIIGPMRPGNSPGLLDLPVSQTATVTGTWTKTGCPDVVRTIEVENDSPPCALEAALSIEDLGDGDYRARVADVTGASGTATATWLKNGAALTADGPLQSAVFSVAFGDEATIAAVISDSVCQIGRTEKFKNSDAGGGGGTAACPPNYYRETVNGPCLPIPVTAIPATPLAPGVAKNCAAGSLTVTAPAFPFGASRLELQREGSAVALPDFGAPGTYDDGALESEIPYRYRVRACNDLGCSAWGAWSAPLALQSAIPVAFEHPLAGASVPLIEQIVVRAGGAVPLFASAPGAPSPVRIYFGATLLPGITRAPGDPRQFFVPLPQNLGAYEGPVTLAAQVRGADGCWSARAEIEVNVSASLLDDTRWGDVEIIEDAPISSVQVAALLDPSEAGSDYTWEFAVACPPPPDSPPPEQPTSAEQVALEATWLRLQKIAPGVDEPLLGLRQSDGTYLPPTSTAICRIRAARKWKTTRFALAAPVVKARREASGDLLFYALPFIYRLSASTANSTAKWEQVADLSGFDLGGAVVDAALRGGKVLALTDGVFYAVDLETGADADGVDISEQARPLGESRPALFIENLDAAPGGAPSWVRVYGDENGAALYESWVGVDGIETRKRWEFPRQVTRFYVEGAQVLLASGAAIYAWARGLGAPLLEITHEADVTFVRYAHLPGDANALWFGDAFGRLFHLSNGGRAELFDDRAFALRAACEFGGGAIEGGARGVCGGDANQVFFEGESDEAMGGVFAALLTLGAGETVTALERLVQTPIPGVGDPLQGGTPAARVDNLLVAVTGPEGNYLLRYQQRERAPLALDGAGLSEIEFCATLSQVEIVEPGF